MYCLLVETLFNFALPDSCSPHFAPSQTSRSPSSSLYRSRSSGTKSIWGRSRVFTESHWTSIFLTYFPSQFPRIRFASSISPAPLRNVHRLGPSPNAPESPPATRRRVLQGRVEVDALGDGVADEGERFSCSSSISRSFLATNASIWAVSRSRKAAMACCSGRGGWGVKLSPT